MESPAFTLVCDELEGASGLTRLQARGTVRILLRDAGLEAHTVTMQQLAVVIDRLLADALRRRGVAEANEVCGKLKARLKSGGTPSRPEHESPEEILRRFSE